MEDGYVNISSEDADAQHGGGHDGDDDLDRKPAAKRAKCDEESGDDESAATGDQRFACAICLDAVSDQPVVTRCGHLYCWPCLYQWLQPGMLLGEYCAAFGPANAGSNVQGGSAGLNFLSDMTSSYNRRRAAAGAMTPDSPFNPAGLSYNERRRCCPVCKAPCTVDSVIPIYIHVHSSSNVERPDSKMRDANDENQRSSDSSESLNLSNELRFGADGSPSQVTDHSTESSAFLEVATTPRGSPTHTANSNSNSNSNTEYTIDANLGLRQRRRGDGDESNDSSTPQRSNAHGFVCDTPRRNQQDLLDGFDNITGNNSASVHSTPVHRNSGSASALPSRPNPTTPQISGSRNATSHPRLSDGNAGFDASHAIQSSSPFRLALHPRRRRHHQGGLTSALMGFAEAVDELAASRHAAAGRPPPSPPVAATPPLHRSDGGLGGIGRASEASSIGPGDEWIGNGMRTSNEESSLALAREFLSRLLLMLACFVILCLLLF